MPGPVTESVGGQSQLAGALGAGIGVISQDAELTFTLYNRVVLPLDGYVFWVRADLLSPSAMVNFSPLNSYPPGSIPTATPALIQKVAGSLHHTTLNQQDETESFSLQQLIFTSQKPVDVLNAIAPNQLWIADWNNLRFAFSSRTGYYKVANVYHYKGDAVYPTLATQIIDNPAQLDASNVIVSNSLPAWLSLNGILPVYPSFLVPDNIEPAYGVIHIGETDTRAIQPVPVITGRGNHWQLASDKVKVTLFGLRNFNAIDYLDYVLQYMTDSGVLGLMNSPIIRDAKRVQTEISSVAMKKVIEFEVSYYQVRVREIAQQLITQALINYTFVPYSSSNLDPTLTSFLL